MFKKIILLILVLYSFSNINSEENINNILDNQDNNVLDDNVTEDIDMSEEKENINHKNMKCPVTCECDPCYCDPCQC